MATKNISSANAVSTLTLLDLYPVPQTLQGFAVDDMFSGEALDLVETRMGVDGYMSAGYTPVIVPITFSFQPDSPSIAVFDFWGTSIQINQTVYYGSLSILLPSIGKSYAFRKVTLKNFKPLPDAKKVLDPVSYTLHCESVRPASV